MAKSRWRRDRRFTVSPTVFSLLIGVAGCGDEGFTGADAELRTQPDHTCTYQQGDLGKACKGDNCVVRLDLELSCPDDVRADRLELGLGEHIWGAFHDARKRRSFRAQGQALVWAELPGDGFAGQAVDGTLYRYLAGHAYLRSSGGTWEEVAVPNLPAGYIEDFGFRVLPDGSGGLHAWIKTGGPWSGSHRLTTQAADGTWSQPVGLGSWDPNEVDGYLGMDGWDRRFLLRHTLDWEPDSQLLLNFKSFDDFPVGENGGDMGKVAGSPRPEIGGEAPIALIRRTPTIHKLLAIVDGDEWTETAIPGTEPLALGCPLRYNVSEPQCEPCHAEVAGVEREAYQLTRTSGGQLWAAWISTEATVDVEYAVEPWGASWRCRGTVSADGSGTLHLVELGADGAIGRTLELELGELGFRAEPGQRELAIAAYGSKIAVLLPTRLGAGGTSIRLMVFDTDALE